MWHPDEKVAMLSHSVTDRILNPKGFSCIERALLIFA